MTNSQAQAYAVMALKSIIEDGVVKGDIMKACQALDREMSRQFDNFEEEVEEKRATRVLEGRI